MRLFRQRWPDVLLTLEEMNTCACWRRSAAANSTPPSSVQVRRISKAYGCTGLTMSRWWSPCRRAIVFARSSDLELKALAQEPFILFPPSLCFSNEVIAACRMNGFDPVVGQVVPQVTSALSLVSAEFGVSIVPASITHLQVKGVTYQPIHGLAAVARLALAVRRDSRQIVIQNFIHALRGAANGIDSRQRELDASFAFA
jgi:DNA-binding transcriptional LysR family regulator